MVHFISFDTKVLIMLRNFSVLCSCVLLFLLPHQGCVSDNLSDLPTIKQGPDKIQQNKQINESSVYRLVQYLVHQADGQTDDVDAGVSDDFKEKLQRALVLFESIEASFNQGALFFKPKIRYELTQACKVVPFSQDSRLRPDHVRKIGVCFKDYGLMLKRYYDQKQSFLLDYDKKTLKDLMELCVLVPEIFSEDYFSFEVKDYLKDWFFYLPYHFVAKHKVEVALSCTAIGCGIFLWWWAHKNADKAAADKRLRDTGHWTAMVIRKSADGSGPVWVVDSMQGDQKKEKRSKLNVDGHDVEVVDLRCSQQTGAECGFEAALNMLCMMHSKTPEEAREKIRKIKKDHPHPFEEWKKLVGKTKWIDHDEVGMLVGEKGIKELPGAIKKIIGMKKIARENIAVVSIPEDLADFKGDSTIEFVRTCEAFDAMRNGKCVGMVVAHGASDNTNKQNQDLIVEHFFAPDYPRKEAMVTEKIFTRIESAANVLEVNNDPKSALGHLSASLQEARGYLREKSFGQIKSRMETCYEDIRTQALASGIKSIRVNNKSIVFARCNTFDKLVKALN